MRLYLAGHNHRLGQAISKSWGAAEIRARIAARGGDPCPEADCAPVRFRADLCHARRLVERFNRRFGG